MIRKLPKTEKRVETGKIQFGDDWPGTFIRGDDSLYYALALEKAITYLPNSLNSLALNSLLKILRGSYDEIQNQIQ